MRYLISIVCSLWVVSGLKLEAQPMLSTAEAAALALAHNYDIQIWQKEVALAENNTLKEANGYLPTIDASVGPSTSFGGSTQEFNNGMSAEVRNAFSWSAGASVGVNYVLFDQQREEVRKQLLKVLDLTNLNLKQQMELTLFELFNQYYFIAQLSEDVIALRESLDVTRKRLERASLRYEYSQGNRVDVLNAEVDVSRDSINLLNAEQQLTNAKRSLNVIMGEPVDKDFSIDTRVSYDSELVSDELIIDAFQNNSSLMVMELNKNITEMDLDVIEASKKPKISANSGLNYNYQKSPAGSFITSSTNTALNLGVTVNWNIFDGGRRKVQEQNAQVTLESISIQKQKIQEELRRDIKNAWDAYQTALYVLEVEENNLSTSQLNLERTRELFNIGQATSVEFRQAQLNYLNSETGFNRAKYAAKLVEIELMFLSGKITTVI